MGRLLLRALYLLLFLVCGCTGDAGKPIYTTHCASCHDTGVSGAPVLGDRQAWAPRLARGRDRLYLNAIQGVRSDQGIMPARGGNPDLTDAQVRAAVDYLAERSR